MAPARQPVQRAAVDRAIAMAAPDGRVDVFGPAEAILDGERYCHQPDHGERVVYHARSVSLSTGGWSCMACPKASQGPDGTA